jgi:glycosyltransferase involved in cell wall biosynthesis
MTAAGGFSGMLAQSTLEVWSTALGETLAVAVESALLGASGDGERTRLVETLGLVRQGIATRPLLEIARSAVEAPEVRAAAVAALGQRSGASVDAFVEEAGPVGVAARLALVDQRAPSDRPERGTGLTVAQLFLHADIDPALTSAGAGDNGGIATLLVRLGDALVADPRTDVRRVVTISRGSIEQAVSDLADLPDGDGHRYGHIPLAAAPVPSAAAWPLRVTARRGIRRILRAAGRIDLLHLRMADVGSLAAADVARELGIPVVFTVAPDPHSVIESLDRSGALTRETFGEVDLREHYWFRADLVQRIAANAAHTVLFPRPALAEDMRSLVGIDIAAHPERHTIVAEGVDLELIERAVVEAAEGAEHEAFAQLREVLEELPAERRGLPVIVTLGRLHRVKGMATLVNAWATTGLRQRANLLVIGGDLGHPSLDERQQLDAIDAVVDPAARADAGLLLAGHRSNDVAARWLAAAKHGVPELLAPNGLYVCASLKEEFGLALLEAMAAGLLVVGPDSGGPATYVEHGETGLLTATWDQSALGDAIARGLDLAAEDAPGRAERARAMVSDHFTIQAMATALGPVYAGVADDEAALLDPAEAAR